MPTWANHPMASRNGFSPSGIPPCSGVGSGGLVFDADGTLWAGDAGEEAFQHALDLDLIREEAAPALRQEAEEVGLSTAGTPSQLARRLLQAFQSGSYPELRACEMMVWCYAGLTEGMLREHARQAFARTTSNVKLYPPLLPLIEWARQRQLRCIIVSASPKLVVEEAVRGLGFDESDVAAARAVVQADILQPVLAEPVPYCASKVSAGVKLLQGSPWLATFSASSRTRCTSPCLPTVRSCTPSPRSTLSMAREASATRWGWRGPGSKRRSSS